MQDNTRILQDGFYWVVVKICYKLLYVIQVVKKILISNFLATTDIKVFGRTCLQCCF